MPMQLLTVMQAAGILGIYLFLVILLPALVFYRRFKKEPFYVRFMVYITAGDFYIINIVLLLQLMHISNRYTLVSVTAALYIAAIVKVYHIKPVQAVKNITKAFTELLKGTAGPRLLLRRAAVYLKNISGRILKRGFRSIRHSWLEWLGVIFIFCLLLWIYGNKVVNIFGYSASDLPVHNYWINEMDKNNIFVAGIYPFGFHCVIYFVHTVYGIKTFVLLRLFGFIQAIFIHFTLLAFIRACCKSKYIPYAATAIYICASFFNKNTFYRYNSALPQEFGMMFILPSIYFVFRFFEERKKEIDADGIQGKKERLSKKQRNKGVQLKRIRTSIDGGGIKRSVARPAKHGAGKKKASRRSVNRAKERLAEDIYNGNGSFDIKSVNESLEYCGEIKDFYNIADGDKKTSSMLFEEMASTVKKAEEYHPWDKVLDELASGKPAGNKETSPGSKGILPENKEMPRDNKDILADGNNITPGKGIASNDIAVVKRITNRAVLFFKNAIKCIYNCIYRIWNTGSSLYLTLFALCFSMTLAVHFYDTMVAGIFCAGIAAGYCNRLFRKGYFRQVVVAGLLSISIAVLPMAAAFASGKPLQGSLGWGMEVIFGSKDNSDTAQDTEDISAESSLPGDAPVENSHPDGSTQGNNYNSAGSKGEAAGDRQGFISAFTGKLVSLYKKILKVPGILMDNFKDYVIPGESIPRNIVFACIWALIPAGLFLFVIKEQEYAGKVMSAGLCTLLLVVVLNSKSLGIPALMDEGRSSIYVAFMVPVIIAFALDVVIWMLTGWIKNIRYMQGVSLLVSVSIVVTMFATDSTRPPCTTKAYETNEAITCLTNIMEENKDGTYTVCSSNDELRMVEGYGYHYETISFLRKMEGSKYLDNLTIPTDKVYFFIEKKPIDYDMPYEDSGQYISAAGAANPLVYSSGLDIYKGRNRWVVMSRMYFWAKAFRKMYGKEMKVYYETDNFVCYVVEQNAYRLYDFSIDYWYNTRQWLFG